MGSKKLQVVLPVLFAIVMIVGMLIGFQLKEKTMSPQFFNPSSRSSLQELTELIKNRYVDKVSADSINGLVANELLKHLDPHSVFIPSSELSAANEDIMGNFQGIGIGSAILKAIIEASKAKNKVIILLTDGEHNSGAVSPKEAVAMAKKAGVKLYTIGIGEKGEFDSKLLSQMASDGSGEYFAAANEKELREVYDQIDTLERSRIKSAQHTFFEHYYQYAIAGALVIVMWLMWRRRVKG